jgi:hypothetical protein
MVTFAATGSLADVEANFVQASNIRSIGDVHADYVLGSNIRSVGDVQAQNITASGLLTASNIRVLGDYVILDTITSNTEQMVITNDGTGPALKVTQTGANSIAEFYDDGNALAFKVANDGLIGIGTATPQAKLHVVGSIKATTSINSDTQFLGQASDTAGAPSFSFATNPNTGIFQPVASNIAVSTGGTERLRVLANGNVGIGTTDPQENLHVEGNIKANGVHRVIEIDLLAQTNTTFYPVHLDNAPAMFTHYFSIEMPSQSGSVYYNMHSLHAVVRSAGWSDQIAKYEVFHNYLQFEERSILGIYGGTQSFYGTIVYLRGGQKYTFVTNSQTVAKYTSAVTLGTAPNTSTFALKNVSGADISSTSVNITQHWSGMGPAGKTLSDTLIVNGNVGIGTTTPLAKLHINDTGAMIIPSGTSAQLPTSPVLGMVRFNINTNRLQFYNISGWNSIGGVNATGGNSVFDVNGYRIHVFTSSSDFKVGSGGTIEYLVVAGGGGGGGRIGGGGGGGGYRSSVAGESSGGGASAEAQMVVSFGTYSVIVGGGGVGGSDGSEGYGGNGQDSSFGTIIAKGGGGGGGTDGFNGLSGGSGGGGGRWGSSSGGSGTLGQGFGGGSGTAPQANPDRSGGGGGASGSGANGITSGNGGTGINSLITGTSVGRAGGGAGNAYGTADAGTATHGGASAAKSVAGNAGNSNTGGGGSGGGYTSYGFIGGNGGSGIVILRYLL